MRLRYVYIHPKGMEESDLYLTFKKSDETVATKNMHELFKVCANFTHILNFVM